MNDPNAHTNSFESFESFREVVVAIADLICCHGFTPEEDGVLREHLLLRGFELDEIRAAENWCDRVAHTGRLIETLSLFAPIAQGPRINSPLERIFVSDRLWKTIEDCRSRGIFSLDMAERLLEGIRAMDTRDWDDSEVKEFIEDACGSSVIAGGDAKLKKALKGDFADYYC